MARIKRWCSGQQLSYLLFDAISRRAALIDPDPALEAEYRCVAERKGLVLVWHLFTSAMPPGGDVSVESLGPGIACRRPRLALGELEIRVLCSVDGTRAAYLCDGLLFTGQWWTAAGLTPMSWIDKQVLLHCPDETLLLPGQVVDHLSVSSIAQEKALCDSAVMELAGAVHG